MFFNNLSFIWFFLPAVLVSYYFLVPRPWRSYFLVVASLVFYAFSGVAYLLLLIADIFWVFAITRGPAYPRNTLRLWMAIAGPLLALIYFKYITFLLVDGLGIPATTLQDTVFAEIILPIGISFFTFELISYAIDRHRGEIEPPAPLINFSLFVTFFPHLVAGPILRYRNVASQISALPTFRLSAREAQEAILQICIGYFIKILLADWLAEYITVLKDQLKDLSAPGALYLVFGFSFQIYFDFFGYSLIAIGLGRLLGIRLPDNFRLPYESRNPREFWRRWHISLSFWLRDYLYFPLGGNQHYVRNILIVFVACGMWHGAGWNFAVWGLTHAFFVIGYHVFARQWDQLPDAMQRGITFVLVSFAWLPFLFGVQQIAEVLGALVVWSPQAALPTEAWLALALSAVACLIADEGRILGWLRRRPFRQLAGGLLAGVALVTCLLFFDRTATFIYFRF